MRPRRLLWVLPHPTPYNIYLMNQLQERLDLPVEAIYRWETKPSHPWKHLPERRFPHREVAPRAGGRDRDLERRAGGEPETLFIFVGWRDETVRPALVRRALRGLPYAFWSDTPRADLSLARLALNRAFVHFARRAVTTLATGGPGVERYLAMGIPSGQVDCFPFVCDPDHFARARAARAERAAAPVRRFFACARLDDRIKGQGVAIEAFARARRARPDLAMELVIAGSGPDEAALKARARELGVGERVRFPGWVEYADLPHHLAGADALVMPSFYDPFPVTVLEAMTAAVPVLGSLACGSVRDRVQDGVSGFTHHAGDAEALAEHMVAVAGDPERARHMGEAAWETAERWGIDHAARVMRGVLRRAARAGAGA